jgi:hypothetical protein
MARLAHKSTDRLSPEAVRLMIAGFRARKTYAAIARDLAEIGVTVPERTIARRGAEWQAEERRRQQTREWAEALVEAAKSSPEASSVVKALATDALLSEPDAFTGADAVKVQRLNLRAQELELKREDLEIRRRQVVIDEKRLALLEERERRMTAALTEEKGEQLSAEERLRRAKEAWGIK